MKDVLTAPFMVEMIRTATNMYAHGWDERNGGNISLMLEENEVREYLDPEKGPARANISRMYSMPRRSIWVLSG